MLAAADWVIGDHGSATCYGAAAGAPVLVASFPAGEVDPASAASWLSSRAARLRPEKPIAPQLAAATTGWPAGLDAAVRDRITDVPGQSGRIIRQVMYQMMQISQPEEEPEVSPVPLPGPAAALPAAWAPGMAGSRPGPW